MIPGIILYEFAEHSVLALYSSTSQGRDADRRRKNTASKQGRLKLLAHHLPSASAAAAVSAAA